MVYISLIVFWFFVHIQYKLVYIFQPQRHLCTFFLVLVPKCMNKRWRWCQSHIFQFKLGIGIHIYLFSMLNMLLTVIYYSHIQYNHNIHSTILHGTKLFKKEIILLFYSLPLNPPKMFRVYFHRKTKPRPLSATSTHIKALYFLQIWQKFTP